ncbi:MAG TPA: hypothetical protein VKP30_16970, partial [Polyangiaceae bacterium]|nr:hypothetical protein [Polyangiaceae bacterium]
RATWVTVARTTAMRSPIPIYYRRNACQSCLVGTLDEVTIRSLFLHQGFEERSDKAALRSERIGACSRDSQPFGVLA